MLNIHQLNAGFVLPLLFPLWHIHTYTRLLYPPHEHTHTHIQTHFHKCYRKCYPFEMNGVRTTVQCYSIFHGKQRNSRFYRSKCMRMTCTASQIALHKFYRIPAFNVTLCMRLHEHNMYKLRWLVVCVRLFNNKFVVILLLGFSPLNPNTIFFPFFCFKFVVDVVVVVDNETLL